MWYWLALGIPIGLALFDDTALAVGFGLAIGTAFAIAMRQR